MEKTQIEAIVLQAMHNLNRGREPGEQIEVSPTATIFGPGGGLDSMSLVALVVDIEEALQDAGCNVILSDARAMSQSRSPFRNVPALVEFIDAQLRDSAA